MAGQIELMSDIAMAGTQTNATRSTLVLDIGKTNVKLMVMSKIGSILDESRMDNVSIDAPPYLHLDPDRIARLVAQANVDHGVDRERVFLDAVDLVGGRDAGHARVGALLPQHVASFVIEGAKPTVDIAHENETPSGGY